nr:immunoglobulin heavy chain junction region [Mus musculus]
CARDGSSLYW